MPCLNVLFVLCYGPPWAVVGEGFFQPADSMNRQDRWARSYNREDGSQCCDYCLTHSLDCFELVGCRRSVAWVVQQQQYTVSHVSLLRELLDTNLMYYHNRYLRGFDEENVCEVFESNVVAGVWWFP